MPDMRTYPRYLPRYPISDMKKSYPIRSRYPRFRTLKDSNMQVHSEPHDELNSAYFSSYFIWVCSSLSSWLSSSTQYSWFQILVDSDITRLISYQISISYRILR